MFSLSKFGWTLEILKPVLQDDDTIRVGMQSKTQLLSQGPGNVLVLGLMYMEFVSILYSF